MFFSNSNQNLNNNVCLDTLPLASRAVIKGLNLDRKSTILTINAAPALVDQLKDQKYDVIPFNYISNKFSSNNYSRGLPSKRNNNSGDFVNSRNCIILNSDYFVAQISSDFSGLADLINSSSKNGLSDLISGVYISPLNNLSPVQRKEFNYFVDSLNSGTIFYSSNDIKFNPALLMKEHKRLTAVARSFDSGDIYSSPKVYVKKASRWSIKMK